MLPSASLRKLATCLALALPLPALAGTVVLTPLIPARGVSPERVQDLLTLMGSELEFMEGVDDVVEVDTAPAALTLACLESTRCLAAITKEHGGDALLTGAVEGRGDELLLDLVFYDVAKNRVVRRKTSTIPADAAKLIDRINPLLVEAITGRTPAAAAQEDLGASSFSAPEDDLLVLPPPMPAPTPIAEPEPAPEPPRQPAPTRSGTARAVDQAIVAPPEPTLPPPAEDDGFDPNAFSFGGGADDISFGAPTPAPQPAPTPSFEEEEEAPPRRGGVAAGTLEEEDPLEDPYDPDVVEAYDEYDEEPTDLDAAPVRKPEAKTRSTGVDGYRRVHITLRAGWAHYGQHNRPGSVITPQTPTEFNFLALNAELQVRVVKGLFIDGGIEPFFARFCSADPAGKAARPGICDPDHPNIKTAPLFPFNFGLLYRFLDKRVQPYAGVDAMFANLGKMDLYGDGVLHQTFTGGARARLGLDIFLAHNIGINFDVALGFWASRGWSMVTEPGPLPTSGFVPRLAGGLTIAF